MLLLALAIWQEHLGMTGLHLQKIAEENFLQLKLKEIVRAA
jgi:hypothetical protein